MTPDASAAGQPLAAADWLDAWDRAQRLPSLLRPCAYLAPLLEDGQAGAEAMSIGSRDARLLDLHTALFGPQMQATARCPACSEQIEFELDAEALRVPTAVDIGGLLDWEYEGYHVQARLPDSRTLLAISRCRDEDSARATLLRRCIQHASLDGDAIQPADLPPAVVAALSEAMALADPQAAVNLELACPACAYRWVDAFDIGTFISDALARWAERTLDHVHVLAGAYGWSEAEILALPPARRRRYIERCEQARF